MLPDAEDQPTLPEHTPDKDRSPIPSWRILLKFTQKGHVAVLSLALVFSLASGIAIPALAIFLGKLFNLITNYGAGRLSGSELITKTSTYGLYLVALGCASAVLNAGYFGFWVLFGELQAKAVRDRLFGGLLEKDMEWFDLRKAGVNAMVQRLQTHIRELQMATSQPLGFTVQYTITTLAALGLAFFYAWDLTLVTLATVPLSGLFLTWMSSRMQPAIVVHTEELDNASKIAANAINNIDTIKCYNGQDVEVWHYAKATKKAAIFYLSQAKANAIQISFVRFIVLSMFVQGFWYGAHLVNIGKRTPGDILTAFWACLMATQTVEQILPQFLVLERGRAAAATLLTTLDRMQSGKMVTRIMGGHVPESCEGDIEVKDVTFSYPSRPGHAALDHASFFLPAGETTFIVGRSGSGKSTLGNLLLKFYTPSSGDVLVDGRSIQTLDINWLRNNVTLAQQQSVLFNETIYRNVAFGRRTWMSVPLEDVEVCIKAAHLDSTIKCLPEGINTAVGARGCALSGGQKQRLAIARARLRDTPILIIDEGTSALDHITRSNVMRTIRSWRKRRTTIIITHDISQIEDDDFAYVMEKGAVVQEGFKLKLQQEMSGEIWERLQPASAKPLPRPLVSPPNRGVGQFSIIEESPRPSTSSSDSMDIQISPKPSKLPRVAGFSEFDDATSPLKTRRASLTPTIVVSRRFSTAPSFFNPPRSVLSPPLKTNDESAWPFPSNVLNRESTEMFSPISLESMNRSLVKHGNESPGVFKQHKWFSGKKASQPSEDTELSSIRAILKTVWPMLLWKKRALLIFGFVFASIHAAATPLFSWVFSKLLGTFFLPVNRSHMALVWSMSVLGVAIGDSISVFFVHFLLESCAQTWVDTLRSEALKRILDQPRAWFDREENSHTSLVESLDRNAEEMRNLLGRFAAFVFLAIVMLVIAIVWSMVLCWKLTLVGLASAPLMYGVTRLFEIVSGRWEKRSNDAGTNASSIFTETFENIKTVRSLTLEAYFHEKYNSATDQARKVGFYRSGYSGLFFGISDSAVIFLTALIFYYGAKLVSSMSFSTENVVTVLTMLLFSVTNANNAIAFLPQINTSRDTAKRLLRLTTLPYRSSFEHTGRIHMQDIGSISFSNVSFSYESRSSVPALRNLTLTIPPSRTTALVGASGCGKSTVSSLILGLYAPCSGSLSISGHHIGSLHLVTLRSLIAVVSQQPALFPGTLAENISYGLPEYSRLASVASIRSAAKAAEIDEFISTLPEGYETVIGEGGSGLSGGQAQRVAIARALVRRPKMLILDEATSGLDGESARAIRQTIQKLGRQGVGILAITHDEEMMKICTTCVVLKDGQVVEQGSYADLVWKAEGELRRLLGGQQE